MPKPVVVGVDGSRESTDAAHWAAREAMRRGLPLRVVHAWEGLPESAESVSPSELCAPQYWARRVLRTVLDRLTFHHPGLYVSAEQVRKAPEPALLAETENAELLVLGSQGYGGVSGLFAGSVALATVAHSSCPVALVRAGCSETDERLPDRTGAACAPAPYRDVALAMDLPRPSDELLEFAFRAAEYRRAPLRVIHAWHHPHAVGLPDADERARARTAVQHAVAEAIAPWREKFPTVYVHEALAEGRPAHEVPKEAGGAGLLVVGRRRRQPRIGARTGPVTHAAMHHVTCPVVVVPHA
ncbi:universal stress protein [Streptomyces flavofungini]|uniref:universal stress protein n=1 Tax=Streptomyces flavofungini TaxID=68200 RepID=UPI0025AF0142|nr:universal stress protein [Streptomyces flavofungini]WJV44740.1 universal stress protein [Streptomyces flavofungini]